MLDVLVGTRVHAAREYRGKQLTGIPTGPMGFLWEWECIWPSHGNDLSELGNSCNVIWNLLFGIWNFQLIVFVHVRCFVIILNIVTKQWRNAMLPVNFTGSIARSASLPVFNLLRGRFWGFSPRRGDALHRNWGEIRHGGGDRSVPHFTRIGATVRVQEPQNWNFYWDLIKMSNINALQGRIACAIFTKFAEFVPRFSMR